MNRQQRIAALEALGFTAAAFGERWNCNAIAVSCTQCQSVVVNGTPTHERNCPNAVHECEGCNEIIPQRQRYCTDCQ